MNSFFLEQGDNFDEMIAGRIALLAFTADFCGPSRILRGVLDQFCAEAEFPIVVIEVDVEAHPTITRQYQVKGTPELLMLNDGEPMSSRLGTMTFGQMLEYVEGELEGA